MNIFYTLGIIVAAIVGLIVATHIRRSKRTGDHLVCPLGHSCDAVINGRFSRFLGVPIERMGQLYYTAVILFYGATLLASVPQNVAAVGLMITGLGFAFSLYLTFIQLVVIKKWCTLCLGSASLSFLILVLAFMSFDWAFTGFIFSHRDLFKWIYMFMVFVGTLVTTFHFSTFLRFLKDFKISRREERRLNMFSQTAWVAIILTTLSGIALVITDSYREITASATFPVLVAMIIVVMVYEVIVNKTVGPHLIDLHFGKTPKIHAHEYAYKRKLAFVFAAIGIISWYGILLFSTFSFYQASAIGLFAIYGAILILATVVGLLVEMVMQRKAIHSDPGNSMYR
jgi:uncharacterized membrane protein